MYCTTDKDNPTILTFNDDEVCKQGLFQLRKISSTTIEAIYSTKHIMLSMEFHPRRKILSFKIQIPRSLCNDSQTIIKGHLGNCDGIRENDCVPDSHGETPIILFQYYYSKLHF